MSDTTTVRLNTTWARRTVEECGGIAPFADALNANKSTVYRHLGGTAEAGPRFIASVLTRFPVTFGDAFDVVDVDVPTRRTYDQREGRAA